MKRIALLFLALAMAIDVSSQAYNNHLLDAIATRRPDRGVLDIVADSPVMTTIEHWALFLIGFGLLSLFMSHRRASSGPRDIG